MRQQEWSRFLTEYFITEEPCMHEHQAFRRDVSSQRRGRSTTGSPSETGTPCSVFGSMADVHVGVQVNYDDANVEAGEGEKRIQVGGGGAAGGAASGVHPSRFYQRSYYAKTFLN